MDRVSTQLRRDILEGRERPGARLSAVRIGKRHGASVSVVREALSRLVAQGLAESEPHQGFRVIPVSVEDLKHLTATRCEIECLAFRQSIESGESCMESHLAATHHTLSRTAPDVPRGSAVGSTRIGTGTHRIPCWGCLLVAPNPRLRAIALSLRDAAELYRQWSVSIGRDDDRDMAGEHRLLLELALNRDADKAVSLLTAHIERTTLVLLDGAAAMAEPDLRSEAKQF